MLHVLGFFSPERAMRGDVRRLIHEALDQNPNNQPYMIFIDLNAPLTHDIEIQNKKWFKDIRKMPEFQIPPTPQNPDPYNAVIFTNYSSHYDANNPTQGYEYLAVISNFPKFPHPSSSFLNLLMTAIEKYGIVPDISPDKIRL